MLTNAEITVYNKAVINHSTTWIRATISPVHWENNKGINIVKTGHENAPDVAVYIPFDSDYSKPYKKEKEFYKDPSGSMTLKSGDLIVKGIISDEENISQSELSKKYDDVFVITSVDTRDYGSKKMQHFEVRAE